MTPTSGDKSHNSIAPCQHQEGFTLLELLVVLAIIVLASAVVIPNITGTETNLLAAQVRQTAAAFNYARRIAIVEGAPQVAILLQMDPSDPDYPDIRGEILQRASAPLLESFDVKISYQADINEEPEELEIIEMVFFPQGGSTGGILRFRLDDLEAGIRVNPITGRIRVLYPGEDIEEGLY